MTETEVSMPLLEDCRDILENWGNWAREGQQGLGYRSKACFYSVGNMKRGVDEALAERAESAMVSMCDHNADNRRHVSLLKMKYYHCVTDREIANRFRVGLQKIQTQKAIAHELFYDYFRREQMRA